MSQRAEPAAGPADAPAAGTPSRDDLVARTRTLVPVLRDRAAATEAARMLPAETVTDLRASGLTVAAQPARFGGLGLDIDAVFAAAVELGRGDGSVAWVGSQWALHNWMVGMWPLHAQEDYFGDDPGSGLISTGFSMAQAASTPAHGGAHLTGRWDFSSGADWATWAILFAPGDTGPAAHLVPRRDLTIDDTWYASGLCGSGSKDVVVQDAYVPQHRILPLADFRAATTPGRDIHGSATYRVPAMACAPFVLAAPILGMAIGAVESFEEQTGRRMAVDGGRAAERPDIQRRLAEATAALDAARLLLEHDIDEIPRRGRHDDITLTDCARWRRDQAWITHTSVHAVNRLFEVSGAHTLYLANDLQRRFRDVNAASHTFSLTWDPVYEVYGRVRLGLDPATTRI